MPTLPRDPSFDSTINLAREGYDFIWSRCRKFQSDLFLTRIMGKPTICIHGADAAALFYDESKFARSGALPRRVVTSLFGKRAVHTLDDASHKARKAAFLNLMTDPNLARLMDETAKAWRRGIWRWSNAGKVVLLDEVQCVLADAICAWAGVPLKASELRKRARDLASMVDGFGGIGPRLWKAKLARMRSERWVSDIIERVRRGELQAAPDTALYVMSHHRDLDGEPLDLKTAARVRTQFTWQGHTFEPGTLVLLDVYGTDHDPRLWDAPLEFRPERFEQWSGGSFDFIPQGGGEHTRTHRCPGEWITMHNVALALHFLTRCCTYEVVPGQNLSVDLTRMPTQPASGFMVRGVRATEALDLPSPRLPSRNAVRGTDTTRARALSEATRHA
jgi:fatty-acid peroxygenase